MSAEESKSERALTSPRLRDINLNRKTLNNTISPEPSAGDKHKLYQIIYNDYLTVFKL